MELRRRVHRLHLARARRARRPRRVRHRPAHHQGRAAQLRGAVRRRPARRRARGADRLRGAARAGRLVRHRLDRARAHHAAGVPELGVVHRRLARAGRAAAVPRHAAPRAPPGVLLPVRRSARARAAGVVADRPVPLRPGAQGDPGGRGQGRVAGYADVHVQAGGVRRVRGLHRPGRRALRALVRRPRPGVPVLHPHRCVHGADGAARRGAQPLRAAARGVGGRHRAGVLQGGVRQHAAAPRRDRPAARPGRHVHAGRRPAGGRRAGQPLPSTAELDPRDDRRRAARRACVHRARAAGARRGVGGAGVGRGVSGVRARSGPPAVANSGGRKEDRP